MPAARSSTPPAPDATSSDRLSTNGVTGSPVTSAVCLDVPRWRSVPSEIQSALPSASPLSKTLEADEEDLATTNGVADRPGATGSERSRTPGLAIC